MSSESVTWCNVRRAAVTAIAVVPLVAGCGWIEVPASRATRAPAPVVMGAISTAEAQPESPAPTRAAGAGAVQRIPADGTVTAQPGDSIYLISRRYGVPMRAVIEANDLSPPYHLRVGQRVILPRGLVHQVQAGDTLHMIARRYGADPYVLARVNRIQDMQTIFVGQHLHVPDGVTMADASMADASPADTPATASAASPTGDGRGASDIQVSELPTLPRLEPRAEPTVSAPPEAVPEPPSGPVFEQQPPPVDLARTAVPVPPQRAGEGFLWPIQGDVIADFGPMAKGLHNDGINIAAPRGTEVRAAESGVVAYAGNELRGFGNLLLIKHADGWVSAYAHNGALLVRRGDTVAQGQVIARVGSSGAVDRPQLHFELRKGPRAVNPREHLNGPIG